MKDTFVSLPPNNIKIHKLSTSICLGCISWGLDRCVGNKYSLFIPTCIQDKQITCNIILVLCLFNGGWRGNQKSPPSEFDRKRTSKFIRALSLHGCYLWYSSCVPKCGRRCYCNDLNICQNRNWVINNFRFQKENGKITWGPTFQI